MEVYEAILTRRSTRNFKPEQVDAESLRKVIEAGRYAPSGGNNQTNRFLVIQNAEILSKLVAMVEEAFRQMPLEEDMYSSLKNSIRLSLRGGYSFCYNAPTLIVVANIKTYGNNMADCAVALENMAIEANELNLGACWINQLRWLNEDPTILAYLRTLGLQESERVYGALALGWPNTEDGLPIRTPLERKGNEVIYI